MKLVSWNVNGIRATMKKDFIKSFNSLKPDVLCLQETKAQDDQVLEALAELDGHHIFSHCAEKKGYSGTAIISKTEPLQVFSGIKQAEHDTEGRVLTAEFKDFYLVDVYTPNSGEELKRLDYRSRWDKAFLKYCKKLEAHKPVVICGDLNVAHQEIDIARPKENYNKSAGYTQKEIDGFDALMAAGFVDTWRHQHPDEVKYSWWSFRAGARPKNIGWRIDYFLVSSALKKQIRQTDIYNEIHGSDHCPVSLTLD